MSLSPIQLQSSHPAAELSPPTVPAAFRHMEELLVSMQSAPPQEILKGKSESLHLKKQLLEQVAAVSEVPSLDATGQATLHVLAGGLLCGALDGSILYSAALMPEGVSAPASFPQAQALLTGLEGALKVADTDWRKGDANGLQMLSGYGKHLNQRTVEENAAFVSRPGTGPAQVQKVLLETFRTGYCIGLVDSAVVFVGNERPGAPADEGNPA